MYVILTLLLSMSVFAFEQNVTLDFRNVYGNFNAGQYEAVVKLKSKKSQSFSALKTSFRRNDNDIFCLTTANFEVGEMIFKVSKQDSDWTKTSTQKIYGSVTHYSDTEKCDLSVDNFVGKKKLYVQVSTDQSPFIFPVKAPFDYEKVVAWLTPFGGYLYVDVVVQENNGVLSINPSTLLTEESINPQANENVTKFYYFLAATKENSTLSLATGVVDFN